MKNILVTGGCGFIGANFIRFLLSAPDFSGRIVNVDKLTYAGNPENLAGIEEGCPGRYHFIQADICDPEAVRRLFEVFDIDSICHFAAESHVDRSIAAPDAFIKTNVVGTFNLLESARLFRERPLLFHHVSTDEVYGDLDEEGYFTEKSPYNPSSPYSASKAASDHLVRAYSRTYGIAVTLSNCSNNYGPYQFPEKLIPLMILNARDGKALPVYGDGRNVRDWLYVEDHCRAIWEIMKRGRRGETYTIGGRCQLKNIDVVERICDILDKIGGKIGDEIGDRSGDDSKVKSRRDLIRFVKDRPGHDRRYAIDCCRLEGELGWAPAETFDTGLEKTVRWYLQNPDWVHRVQSGEYRQWIQQHYNA